MNRGIEVRRAETKLTERAIECLRSGPVDPVRLIEHVCQIPGAPRVIAEQMAFALFAGRPEFEREETGSWRLIDSWLAAQREINGAEPIAERHGEHVHNLRAPGMCAGESDLLCNLSYVVVDVETTGSSPWNGDRVIEVAAIVVRDGAIVDHFETLVNPDRAIPPVVSALTRISWGMVKDAPRFGEICDDLLATLSGNVFVAHNAMFDWRFICQEVERASGRRLVGRRLCTVRMARRILPHLWSRRLDVVAQHYGIEIAMRHRAGGDAAATAHLLLCLLREAGERECTSWGDLQRLLRKPAAKRPRRRRAMPRSTDTDATA
ncbi:MAG: PolC-type DNA polymerase III [Gemmatimonadaceae bacterium]